MRMGLGWTLFLILLTLKLASVITWSWLWVTAPLWGSALLVLLLGALGVVLLMEVKIS